jgi:hypothetical protein
LAQRLVILSSDGFFLNPYKPMLEECLKIGHTSSLSDPFKLTITPEFETI